MYKFQFITLLSLLLKIHSDFFSPFSKKAKPNQKALPVIRSCVRPHGQMWFLWLWLGPGSRSSWPLRCRCSDSDSRCWKAWSLRKSHQRCLDKWWNYAQGWKGRYNIGDVGQMSSLSLNQDIFIKQSKCIMREKAVTILTEYTWI